MTIRKFNGHPYAQATIHEQDNGTIALVSYTTTVIVIDADGWMYVRGLYSRTTIKHIGWFMKEIGLTYQHAKRAYIDEKEYNIRTGEYRNI